MNDGSKPRSGCLKGALYGSLGCATLVLLLIVLAWVFKDDLQTFKQELTDDLRASVEETMENAAKLQIRYPVLEPYAADYEIMWMTTVGVRRIELDLIHPGVEASEANALKIAREIAAFREQLPPFSGVDITFEYTIGDTVTFSRKITHSIEWEQMNGADSSEGLGP